MIWLWIPTQGIIGRAMNAPLGLGLALMDSDIDGLRDALSEALSEADPEALSEAEAL